MDFVYLIQEMISDLFIQTLNMQELQCFSSASESNEQNKHGRSLDLSFFL